MANRFWIQKNSKSRYFDTLLLLILLLLIVFGLLVIYSVSSYDGYVTYGNSWYYFKRQLIASGVGLALMIVVSFVPYHLWIRFRWLVIGFATLMLLLLIPFGTTVNGAKRWIYVFGVSIQPAEIAKVAVIIISAYMLVRIGNSVNSFKGIVYAAIPAAFFAGLVLVITTNLSSAIIVFGIAVIMIFVAGKDYKRYILATLILIAGAALYVYIIYSNRDSSLGYRGERVLAWLDPNAYASGKGFQTLQALYAIGSGGIMGKGIGQSMQKLGYIPEAQNDMIFAIICEELGFVGAICVIAMFLLLLWRCLIIAYNAPDMFGAFLVIGFMAHISLQVILNIAVVTNTIPNTGISLPFISYGGSAVMCILFEAGLVMSVGRSIRIKET